MKKLIMLLAAMAFAGFAMAQTYTEGSGITGVDKLGAHQNGGRGCVGCHAPHSGARGNGGNQNGANVSDANTGSFALWGQDLGPLYGQTLGFGDTGKFGITLPSTSVGLGAADEAVLTGVMTCLSCHDGNIAKGAMMTNQSYEQIRGLLPPGYGPYRIPTLLGNDGTAAGNYQNDHPIGPYANLSALGSTGIMTRVTYNVGGCGTAPNTYDCLLPDLTKTDMSHFYTNYGAFNITSTATGYNSGARNSPLVLPTTNIGDAYVVCTTCHTPHSMYTFSGKVRNSSSNGTYPTYFFIAAPYNPGAPVTDATKASSATQFCRQCHFTGAGGSNEGSGIYTVNTQF